jgi:hypothetical protein
VTGAAIAAIGARGELALVIIFPVTIQAPLMSYRRFEIAGRMAGLAEQGGMFAFQTIFGRGVVEGEGFLHGLPIGD